MAGAGGDGQGDGPDEDGDAGREHLEPKPPLSIFAEEFQKLQKAHPKLPEDKLPKLDPWHFDDPPAAAEPWPTNRLEQEKARGNRAAMALEDLRRSHRTAEDWMMPSKSRLWLVNGLYPWGLLGMLSGDGGVGKTLLMQQLLTCVAMGKPWLGFATMGGRALGFFGEDDEEDIHRRQDDINRHMGIKPADLGDMLQFYCRGGLDNILMEFDQGTNVGRRRPLFDALRAEIMGDPAPSLVVLDTLAEIYGGNENVRTQVSQFINALRALCVEADCTIILTAHPSLTGMSTKSGLSGSTHWNNGVRARLYLTRPEIDKEVDLKSPRRYLKGVKANFGATGDDIVLLWTGGVFIRADQDPILASAGTREAEDYFLATLDKLTAQGRHVSDSGHGGRYAPKIFAKETDNPGFKAPELMVAMINLFNAKRIKVESIRGADRHFRPCIVRAEGGVEDAP